jgi:hypothetical protein
MMIYKSASWYSGTFFIVDTLIGRDKTKVYVLYGNFFSIQVKDFEMDSGGNWYVASSTEIARRSEITPPLHMKFLQGNTPEIYLEILARDRKGDQKAYPQKWVLRDKQWKRK